MSKQVVLVVPADGVILNPQRRLSPSFLAKAQLHCHSYTNHWYGFMQGYDAVAGHSAALPQSGVVALSNSSPKWWEVSAGISALQAVSLADNNLKFLIGQVVSVSAPGFIFLVNPQHLNQVQEVLWELQILQDVADYHGALSIA